MYNPLVSIILPTYNGSKFISNSIDSVLNQTYTNFELIIINDASTDNVESIILDYQKKDNRVIYIQNNDNLKLTKSLNKAIGISKGKYIARIDDDDIWINIDKLKKQVCFLEKNLDYGLIGTNAICIDSNEKVLGKIKHFRSNYLIKFFIFFTNQFIHSSILIKKSIIDNIGLYNPKWNYIEDYELWLRIGKRYKVHNLNDYSINYRILENSITGKNNIEQNLMILKVIKGYKKYYNNYFLAYLLRKILILIKLIKEKIKD